MHEYAASFIRTITDRATLGLRVANARADAAEARLLEAARRHWQLFDGAESSLPTPARHRGL
jgi:hypothetical protein